MKQNKKAEETMTGKDLLFAMNELEEAWIEEGAEQSEKKRISGRSVMRWAVAATLALLLCGGGVAYAAVKFGVFQFTSSDEETKPGYSLTVETERISVEELTGGIREVKDFLLEQMAEEDYCQTYPSWLKEFATVEEARAYIGYAGMKETKSLGTPKQVNVRVIGDTSGNLGEVSLFVSYETEGIAIHETSAVFTEKCPFTFHGTGMRYVEEIWWKESYRKEEYTTESGKSAVLVYEEREDGGNRYLIGALTDGAMYYECSVLYYPQDLEKAKEILYEWLEQF